MPESSDKDNSSKTPDPEFYWNWSLHEVDIFTNRANLFLLVETIMVGAAVTLATNTEAKAKAVLALVCSAGMFLTCLWLAVNFFHQYVTHRTLKKKLSYSERRWAEIHTLRRDLAANHFLIGIVMPVGFILLWGLLFPRSLFALVPAVLIIRFAPWLNKRLNDACDGLIQRKEAEQPKPLSPPSTPAAPSPISPSSPPHQA